jgi:phosphonate transport system substrate-binding protein
MLNRRSLFLAGAAAIAPVGYHRLPSTHDIVRARPGLAIGARPEGARGVRASFAAGGSTSGGLIPTHCFRSCGIYPKTGFGYREGASHPADVIVVGNAHVELATRFDRNLNAIAERGLAPNGDSALGRG